MPADALPSSAGSEAAINRIEDLIAQWWVCVVYTIDTGMNKGKNK